jgi:hypothetical protein
LVIGGSFDYLFMLDSANGTTAVGCHVAVCISSRVDLESTSLLRAGEEIKPAPVNGRETRKALGFDSVINK